MAATLRVHRGPASPERVLLVETEEMGTLSDEITEFAIPPGHHLVALKLGRYHSVATYLTLAEGQVVDLTVEENPDAILPVIQGGYLRFHRD